LFFNFSKSCFEKSCPSAAYFFILSSISLVDVESASLLTRN